MELKNCPFCGGGVELVVYSKGTVAFCGDCRAKTKLCKTTQKAIDAWNKRVK